MVTKVSTVTGWLLIIAEPVVRPALICKEAGTVMAELLELKATDLPDGPARPLSVAVTVVVCGGLRVERVSEKVASVAVFTVIEADLCTIGPSWSAETFTRVSASTAVVGQEAGKVCPLARKAFGTVSAVGFEETVSISTLGATALKSSWAEMVFPPITEGGIEIEASAGLNAISASSVPALFPP